MDKQQFFHSHLQPGSIVFDVGANVVFYTLLSSVIVGETGHIFAFEPLPRNLDLLQKHLTLNKLENVTVLPLAIADRVGTAQFEQGPRHTWGRIGDHGDINVKISTLDFLLELQQVKIPDFIKIDVEGAEVDVLRGGENLLRSYSPVIILETHGEELYTECVSLLKQYGYEVHDFVAATQEREIFAVKK